MMRNKVVIGVDLGGTNVTAGRINGIEIEKLEKMYISAKDEDPGQVLTEVIGTIEKVFTDEVDGIGIGVPSLVDAETGVVRDVQNIPSWKEVALKEIISEKFDVPVFIDNDANCFAAGEKYFGKAQDADNFVGLIIGTGMGAGIFIKGHLYTGQNCGAGEFGMLPYKDKVFESYCSGQYFIDNYQMRGEEVYNRAQNGDREALEIFEEFGKNLGVGITAILYALDPEMIILGGSVSQAYGFFKDRLWEQLRGFAYSKVVDNLKIEISEKSNIAVFGAAGLYYNAQ